MKQLLLCSQSHVPKPTSPVHGQSECGELWGQLGAHLKGELCGQQGRVDPGPCRDTADWWVVVGVLLLWLILLLLLLSDLLKCANSKALTDSYGFGLAEPGDCQSKCLLCSNWKTKHTQTSNKSSAVCIFIIIPLYIIHCIYLLYFSSRLSDLLVWM